MEYILMNKNKPVLIMEIDDGYILSVSDIISAAHLPVSVSTKPEFMKSTLRKWWTSRSIPASRENILNGLNNLGMLSDSVPPVLLEKCFGLSLSDQYWIKPLKSDITWSDINFFENNFSEDIGKALFDNAAIENPDFMSPDNTSDGCLKKKWKIIDNERILIKSGGKPFLQQPFNEVIASAICKRLDIKHHVEYNIGIENNEPVSLCRNFITPDTELVSAFALLNSQKQPNSLSVYQFYISLCTEKGIANIKERLDEMLVLDFIIRNEDRHYRNFGLIRNVETLEYVDTAPIFDSGSSLLYNTATEEIKREAISRKSPSKAFRSTQDECIRLVNTPERFDLSKLKNIDDEIYDILRKGNFISENRAGILCNALTERISKLERNFLSNHSSIFLPKQDTAPLFSRAAQKSFSEAAKANASEQNGKGRNDIGIE